MRIRAQQKIATEPIMMRVQDAEDSVAKHPELPAADACINPVCLADKQCLRQEIQSLKQELLSLQSKKNLTDDHHTSSQDSLIRHLKESNANLTATLAKERERFEQERRSWISFKRNYATAVVEKLKLNNLADKFINQPIQQPFISLNLGAHEQQKQRDSDFVGTRSPQDTHKEDAEHLVDEPASGPQLPQQSTSQSSHATRTLDGSQPKSPVQVPTEQLCKKEESLKTPVKQHFEHAPISRRLVEASLHGPDKVSHGRDISPSKNIASKNETSSRKRQIAPITPSRKAISPRGNGRSPGMNLISPGRNRLSPRKNGITTGRYGNGSVTRPNPLSLRLKPQLDGRVNKSHDFTPELSRKRSVSSTTSRSKLQPSKWIRYSDRKARAGKILWNDHREDKPKKIEPKSNQVDDDDVFRVQTKQDPLPPHVISKPVEQPLNAPVLEPSSEDLPTTEESDTELTSVQKRISSIAKCAIQPIENGKIALIEPDLNNNKKGKMKAANDRDEILSGDDVESSCFVGAKEVDEKRIGKTNLESTSKEREININDDDDDSIVNIHDRFEIDPKNNFGVNHIFDEVARGKDTRKNMRARDCECCAGYYEQAAKDLNQAQNQHEGDCSKIISEHQHRISRHRHFHPPPVTPPGYWQLGFPDTQEVENINQKAEQNKKLKLKNIQLQAMDGIGPYRFKDNGK